MDNQHLDKDTDQISLLSDSESYQGRHSGRWQKKSQVSTYARSKASELSKKQFAKHHGVKSATSSSSARQGRGSLRSSTSYSDTTMCTLLQAKNQLGSTATTANVFSLLTSIKGSLNAKHSMSYWMDILADLQSKAGLQSLGILLELLSPMSHTVQDGQIQQSDDSTQEDFSDSTGDTFMDSQAMEGSDSDYGSSDQSADQQTWNSSRDSRFYDQSQPLGYDTDEHYSQEF